MKNKILVLERMPTFTITCKEGGTAKTIKTYRFWLNGVMLFYVSNRRYSNNQDSSKTFEEWVEDSVRENERYFGTRCLRIRNLKMKKE